MYYVVTQPFFDIFNICDHKWLKTNIGYNKELLNLVGNKRNAKQSTFERLPIKDQARYWFEMCDWLNLLMVIICIQCYEKKKNGD